MQWCIYYGLKSSWGEKWKHLWPRLGQTSTKISQNCVDKCSTFCVDLSGVVWPVMRCMNLRASSWR